MKTSELKKAEIPEYTVEDPKCIHLIYIDKIGYCPAQVKDKQFHCDHADYNANSYFPPCRKYPKQYH